MSPDPAAVRAAAAADPAFAAVFAVLAHGRNGRSSGLRRVAAGRDRPLVRPVPAGDVGRVFERLAALGVGEYVGRGTRRARFAWQVRVKAVIAAAEGRLTEWHPAHFIRPAAASPAPPAPVGPPPLPAEWQRHRLPLEPGREVELAFPPDITADEARWIGDYLERLAKKAVREAKKPSSPE